MARAPFQILVLPFRRSSSGEFEFATLCRSDDGSWQGVAGGGEAGETPEAAAIREATEEIGVPPSLPFYRLDSQCSIPVHFFSERLHWPADLFVIPEYSFAVDCTSVELRLSKEHVQQRWGPYKETRERLRWDSNKTALWELNERLRSGQLGTPIQPG
jgi:dATP pyrophosphohydrolase